MILTGDETADFLLRQLKIVRRIGTPAQKQDLERWETVIRKEARPDVGQVANFATKRPDQSGK